MSIALLNKYWFGISIRKQLFSFASMMVAIPVNKCTAFISMVLCSRRICRIMFFFASLFHSSSTTTLEHQQPNSYRCFFCWCFFAFVFFHFPWPSTMNCIFTTCFYIFLLLSLHARVHEKSIFLILLRTCQAPSTENWNIYSFTGQAMVKSTARTQSTPQQMSMTNEHRPTV